MKVDILSLFPAYFQGPFDVSIIKRAKEKGILEINLIDVRNFALDKHKKVDDRPFGGGPGMLMKPEPLTAAIRSVKTPRSKVIYLTPQGKKLTAALCQELAKEEHLVLVCGHYEGIDQRVIDAEIDEEISIGDYVLTNGCLAAIVLIDATIRFIPQVLGHVDAAAHDTFEGGHFEGPQYTRPEEFEGREVPEVLKSGHHADIAKWKAAAAVEKMQKLRPDLGV